MQPPRNIVDLSQFNKRPQNNDPQDNAPAGMTRLTIEFNPEHVPLAAASQWLEEGVAGYAILESYANGRIKLDDRDVERIAQRVAELLASKPTRGQAKALRDRTNGS